MAWRLTIIVALAAALMAQSGETYKARLAAVAADARTRPELAGLGSASASLAGSKLTISGTFDGLRSPATAVQLRAGVTAGVRGPVVQDLTISKAAAGTISGSIDLTPQQIDTLHKGGFYLQILSEKAPEGVLWGWLLR